MSQKYKINEIFYSIQGEGMRCGTANVFVRFSDCNLKCSAGDKFADFDCDTEFTSGTEMTANEIYAAVRAVAGDCRWVIFTGGEPLLQLDDYLLKYFIFRPNGLDAFNTAIETNGTLVPKFDIYLIDWLCISPKSAEHTLQLVERPAHELKYVRNLSQSIPVPALNAQNYLISPACGAAGYDLAVLNHCVEMVKANPMWRLSLQTHKFLGVR